MTGAEMQMVAAFQVLGMSEASASRLAEQMAEAVRDACAAGLRVTCEAIVGVGDEYGAKAALALARYLLATCEPDMAGSSVS